MLSNDDVVFSVDGPKNSLKHSIDSKIISTSQSGHSNQPLRYLPYYPQGSRERVLQVFGSLVGPSNPLHYDEIRLLREDHGHGGSALLDFRVSDDGFEKVFGYHFGQGNDGQEFGQVVLLPDHVILSSTLCPSPRFEASKSAVF